MKYNKCFLHMDAEEAISRGVRRRKLLNRYSLLCLTALPIGVAALTVGACAQQYRAVGDQEITIDSDTAASVSSGSAVSASGGGKVSGSNIAVSSGETAGSAAIFSAGANSLVSLNGASTITTNSVAVKMTNSGVVSLGGETVINITGSEPTGFTPKGAAGIMLNGSTVDPAQMGSGITININGADRTDNAAWIGVALVGASDSATFDKLTIRGESADVGAYVKNGAKLTLTNGDITINGSVPKSEIKYYADGTQFTYTGNAQAGLSVFHGSEINLTNTNITVNSAGGAAIRAQTNTIVNVSGGVFNINSKVLANSTASGIIANSSTKMNITGTIINVAGDGYTGLEMRASSNLVADGLRMNTTGKTAVGIELSASTGTLTDTAVTGQGDGSWGIDVNAASTMTMTRGSVSMQGADSNGVVIRSPKASSSFTGADTSIATTGANSNGFNIGNFSTVTLTNTVIDAVGVNNKGIAVGGEAVTVTMSGGHVTSTATAVHVQGAGAKLSFSDLAEITSTSGRGFNISANDVVVKISNSSTVESADTAFDISGSGASLAISDGSKVTNASGPAFAVSGTAAMLDISNAAEVTGGNGVLLDVAEPGSADLVASNGARLNGDIQAAKIGSASVSLSGGVAWTGAARGVGAASISDSSAWEMTGNSDVASLLFNNSDIRFRAPAGNPAQTASYKTLTVRGDYAGDNGRITLHTFLGSDDSPTDRLVVQGGTSGSSLLSIVDTGGPGGLTKSDGIMVVSVQGASDGQFALANRVAGGPGGAYEYLLFHGGNAETGGDANDGNWYLRNRYTPPPTPDDPAPEPVPFVRPEIPTYVVIPPLAIEYGYSMLGTLHERVGETFATPLAAVTEERHVWCKDPKRNFRCTVKAPVATAGGDRQRWFGGAWARAIGDRGFHEPGNFFRRGPDYDYTFGGVEAGMDVWARQQADGALDKAGFYIGYGQIAANVKNQFGGKAGTVDMEAYTVAGYWTHYAPSGWYTDAVIQGTWYAADASSVKGEKIEPDGFGILGSLEGGYSFKLGSDFTLEPQAQVVYQNVSFDKARDSFSFVDFNDSDSLRGRLGLRLTRTWNMADQAQPRLITGWLRANVWHEFMGDAKTLFISPENLGSMSLPSPLGGTWGELNAGVTAQINDEMNLFTTGSYSRSFDNEDIESWDGRIGMTIKW